MPEISLFQNPDYPEESVVFPLSDTKRSKISFEDTPVTLRIGEDLGSPPVSRTTGNPAVPGGEPD